MTTEEFDIMIKEAFDSDPKFNLFDIKYDFTPAKISRKTDRFVKKLSSEMFCAPSKPTQCRRFRPRYLVAAIIGASVLTAGAVGISAYRSKYSFSPAECEMEFIRIESSGNDKTRLEEIYTLAEKPEGYITTRDEFIGFSDDYILQYDLSYGYFSKRETEENWITFSQSLIDPDARHAINTENAVVEITEINGEEAIYVNRSIYTDDQMLIWTYDGYKFKLSAHAPEGHRAFSKEELLETARTIQIKN
ncbi:MAG: DUF4367 domain-containing protein [Oscillospiraceae bacterium]|nr:DUF4367 domain-containing protein [Oscillospiraceae bacterium]